MLNIQTVKVQSQTKLDLNRPAKFYLSCSVLQLKASPASVSHCFTDCEIYVSKEIVEQFEDFSGEKGVVGQKEATA